MATLPVGQSDLFASRGNYEAQSVSDAIIVLGRGISKDGELSADSRSRVRKAAELYKEGIALKIVVSGKWSYHADTPPPRTEAAAMKAYAEGLGVRPGDIICEEESMDTIGNIYFVKKHIAEVRGWRNFTIVASGEHLPRAQYLCEKICGDEYEFAYRESERVLDDEEYAKELVHERNSLETTRKWLGEVKNGDDSEIWRLIQLMHPAYKQH